MSSCSTQYCSFCFDGTIIKNSQVCDSIIDCNDLSDECTCEVSDVKPLCDQLFRYQVKNLNLSFNFSIVCDLSYDLESGLDEIFCDTKMFEISKVSNNSKQYMQEACSKGKTIINKNVTLPQVNRDLKTVSSLLDNKSTKCIGTIQCPYFEDECSSRCRNPVKRADFFVTCFSFLFENSIILVKHSNFEIYDRKTFYYNSKNRIQKKYVKSNYPEENFTLYLDDKVFYVSDKSQKLVFEIDSFYDFCNETKP